MANPDGPENLAWGTLEELLLACAVHRFGTNSWDSVAKEIQKRSSTTSFRFITSHNCKQKYYDLKRRFTAVPDAALEDDDTVPWLDELRSRRITELKGELQRYDLSIVSLQLKVKRLAEEREQRLTENEKGPSDLEKDDGQTGTPPSPLPDAGDEAPAVESDRDNQSVNASNSSDPKGEKSGEDAGDKKPAEPCARLPADPQEDTAKATGEESYNGSSDTIAAAKMADVSQDLVSAKTEPVCGSPELVETMADLKHGEKGRAPEMEASEVQSYGILSEKEGWHRSVNSVEDAENQSAVGKSEPLADLLDVIRRHKFGSVFERRLESQESNKYKNMIREHVDLATIRTRLEEGLYRECESKLYRDLLLLTTNATLYFPKRALEHKAAIELRKLISTKVASKAAVPCPPTTQPNPESETTLSRAESPPILNVLSPVIACRKRSSKMLLKPASVEKKIDSSPTGTKIEEKEKSGSELEKTPWLSTVKKKRTRDQRTSSAKMGSTMTSSGGPSSNGNSSSSNAVTGGVGKKKKSAMNFMNRIKSSPTKQTESLKSDLNVNVKSDSKGEATKNGGNDKRNSSGNARVSKEKKKGEGSKMNAGPSPATAKSASAKEKGKKKEASKGEGSKMNTRAAALAGKRSGDKVDGAAPKKRSRK